MTDRTSPLDGPLPPGPITAYRLDGNLPDNHGLSRPGDLRGTGILESRPVNPDQADRLRSILADAASYGSMGMRCFIPGMGFTMGNGSDAVDVLICLRCYWVFIYRGPNPLRIELSDAGHRSLAQFYVELFPGEHPELP